MSGILIKMKSIHSRLSKVEKNVADYILKNYDVVPYKSVVDIANGAYVSIASVSRFVKKIGYKTVKDFKVNLAKDISAPFVSIYQELSSTDSDQEMVKKAFLANMRSIEETLKILEISQLIQFAEKICTTKRLVFFGIGGSANIARDASMRFSHLDIQAESYIESALIIAQALRLKKDEIAVGISHSGRSKIVIEALKIARQNGAFSVGISNYFKSHLHGVSDCFFCTSFPENKVKVFALSSRIAQLCLIDALYLLVARYKESLWNIEKLNSLNERLLRFPE